MEIERIAIVGAGTMGHGIAQVCASHGHPVSLIDIAPEQLARALVAIRASVEKLHDKGRLSAEQRDAALNNVTTSTPVTSNVYKEPFLLMAASSRNRPHTVLLAAKLPTTNTRI